MKKGNDMASLLVKLRNKIHYRALSRLVKDTLPLYEADGGPLSHADLHAIQKAAELWLPKGRVVKKRALL